jgi:hypothetical protein
MPPAGKPRTAQAHHKSRAGRNKVIANARNPPMPPDIAAAKSAQIEGAQTAM